MGRGGRRAHRQDLLLQPPDERHNLNPPCWLHIVFPSWEEEEEEDEGFLVFWEMTSRIQRNARSSVVHAARQSRRQLDEFPTVWFVQVVWILRLTHVLLQKTVTSLLSLVFSSLQVYGRACRRQRCAGLFLLVSQFALCSLSFCWQAPRSTSTMAVARLLLGFVGDDHGWCVFDVEVYGAALVVDDSGSFVAGYAGGDAICVVSPSVVVMPMMLGIMVGRTRRTVLQRHTGHARWCPWYPTVTC